MSGITLTHAESGRATLNHNNRVFVYDNVDPNRIKNNIYYAKETLDEAYKKCFEKSFDEHNNKQTRSKLKFKNYYEKKFGNANKDNPAKASNREKSFYEDLIQIGGMDNCSVGSSNGEIATKILDEYAKSFSERNPNFYVFNSVLHLDEKTPHLHIDYIPIANGYKTGQKIRNSHSIALKQMGFDKGKQSIADWRKKEREFIREICKQHGLEVEPESEGRKHTYTPREFKREMDKIKKDPKVVKKAKEELKKDPTFIKEVKDELKKDQNLKNQVYTAVKQEYLSTEKAQLEQVRAKLKAERLEIEGGLAAEPLIKKLIDGTQEKTFLGNTKTTITYEGTKDKVFAVLKTAQRGARDRINNANLKAERDEALAEKTQAIKERDTALEKARNAENIKATADKTMKEAKALKEQVADFDKTTSDLKKYKSWYTKAKERADNAETRVKGLETDLHNGYVSLGAMGKAASSLLHDQDIKIGNLSTEQSRVLQAMNNYAVTHSRNAGFEDIAQNTEKYYGLSKGIQKHIDDLKPKAQTKKRSYDMGL